MSVKCEILSEDVFKAKNAYLRPFMAITLVIMGMSRGISQVFSDICQYFRYFPVFPLSRPGGKYLGREIQVFPEKLPTLR